MQAQITVTRTPYNVEQFVTVEVELDRDGDVFAKAVEDVYAVEDYLYRDKGGGLITTREEKELLATKGKPFELESDDEILEAKKAIASN